MLSVFRKERIQLLLIVFFFCCLPLILSFSILDGNAGSNGGTSAREPDAARPVIRLEVLEKRIHDLVNEERKKQGLNFLDWNPDLNRIARLHSRDMASRNYFSHENPAGLNFERRYRQQGFTCRIGVGNGRYSLGGENLFQNNLCRSVTYIRSGDTVRTVYAWNSMEQIARSTVDGWMKSPGHRKNILQPFWKTEGIGIAISGDEKVFITQNFC